MKKLLLSAVLFLTAALNLNSQTLFTENFSYIAGDSLGAHGWTGFSGFGTNIVRIVSPGLSYPGYGLSAIGNAVRLGPNGQDIYKEVTPPDSIGTFFISFMISVDTARTGDYFLGLLSSTSTSAYTLRIFVKRATDSTFYLGLSKSNPSDTSFNYTTSFPLRKTILVVGKYIFADGTNIDDNVALFAFTSGVPQFEPPVPLIGPTPFNSSFDLTNIGKIALRQGTAAQGPNLVIDGIKLTKSWPKVITSITREAQNLPDDFVLSQNYPNPFNPNTVISYRLSAQGDIAINVYDASGRFLKTLESGFKQPGNYSVNFSGEGLSSGVYTYSLVADGVVMDTKKMILLK